MYEKLYSAKSPAPGIDPQPWGSTALWSWLGPVPCMGLTLNILTRIFPGILGNCFTPQLMQKLYPHLPFLPKTCPTGNLQVVWFLSPLLGLTLLRLRRALQLPVLRLVYHHAGASRECGHFFPLSASQRGGNPSNPLLFQHLSGLGVQCPSLGWMHMEVRKEEMSLQLTLQRCVL